MEWQLLGSEEIVAERLCDEGPIGGEKAWRSAMGYSIGWQTAGEMSWLNAILSQCN